MITTINLLPEADSHNTDPVKVSFEIYESKVVLILDDRELTFLTSDLEHIVKVASIK